MKSFIFRHGESPYKQGNRTCTAEEVETALDLTDRGIGVVLSNATRAAGLLDPKGKVTIVTSPVPRCVHSARLIRLTLRHSGFNWNAKVQEQYQSVRIRVEPLLCEVRNFVWDVYRPLFEGGEVTWEGRTFTIDKKETNPSDLNDMDYFYTDSAHKIPEEVLAQYPISFVEKIRKFERTASTHDRMMEVLSTYCSEDMGQVIFVTHNALVGWLAALYSDDKNAGLAPGNYISLVCTENGSFIEGISGGITGTPCEIIEAYENLVCAKG